MDSYFKASFFAHNREQLLHEVGRGALIVLTAFGQMQRGNDTAFLFEQEPNFWYLSGIDKPDWWLIIDGAQNRTWLVSPDIDEIRQVFDGGLDNEAATAISGADSVIDRTEARRLLAGLRSNHRIVYTVRPQTMYSHYGFYPNPALKNLGDELRMFEMRDCRKEVATLRAIKQEVEIKAIKKAISITISGFNRVMAKLTDIKYGYEIEAELTYEFRRLGASGHAFEPVIATGKDACTIHHITTDQVIARHSWLLMDVGARFQNYCADIARTIPMSNQFSDRQQSVYGAVERVHNMAVKLCNPGMVVAEYLRQVDAAMSAELIALKLISSPGNTTVMRKYFPHAISHGLGIDPHDPLGAPVLFKPGMVLAVEPGIYIPEEKLGIRIENNILITDDGPINLSKALPTNLNSLLKLL